MAGAVLPAASATGCARGWKQASIAMKLKPGTFNATFSQPCTHKFSAVARLEREREPGSQARPAPHFRCASMRATLAEDVRPKSHEAAWVSDSDEPTLIIPAKVLWCRQHQRGAQSPAM